MDEINELQRKPKKALTIALFLTCFIFIVEVLGGIISNSLALYSDAGHVLTDIFAIGLALFATYQAERLPNIAKTFGYYRIEILAALVNATTLILIAIVIIIEAYFRFLTPEHIRPFAMFISAGVGIVTNLYIGFGLEKEKHNLNMKAAAFHAFGDVGASIAVIIAGAIVLLTGATIFDPILSVGIAILIAFGAYRIVKETMNVLLEGVPKDISIDQVKHDMLQINGVKDIHDLHIWTISSDKYALSCHAVVDDIPINQTSNITRQLKELMKGKYNVSHTTVEYECVQDVDTQCLEGTL